jgi:hypothetical protein
MAEKEIFSHKADVLRQRGWSESHQTALAEVNRLVQQYKLAEALAFLNKEFVSVSDYPSKICRSGWLQT